MRELISTTFFIILMMVALAMLLESLGVNL
jgi:hypothetical protein